jgi:gliding motility-associated-like protein
MRVVRLLFLLSAMLFSVLSKAQVLADFMMDKTGGCSPITINFTNLSSGASPNAKYSWDFGNGNMSSLKNPSAIYLQEKTYTVTLTVTDGNNTSTKTKTITVYKRPVVDFSSASAKVCLPAAAQFNSTSTAGDGFISNYQWDFGDGTTQYGYGNQMSHYYYNEQIATVSLTVTNSYGCQSSITKPNIVEILPKIDPVFTVDQNLLCTTDSSIHLTNNSTGPGTLLYSWNFGDGTSSSQKNPVHQFSKKGVYSVSLTVSNTDGCSVTSYPTSVNAAFFKTDFSTNALCRQIGFSSSSYIGPSNSFWQFGDGTSANSYYNYNLSHTYPTAGTYSVTLINTYGSCKDTVTKTITVQDQVNFNSNIVMPASLCLGTSANFTETSTAAPGLMNWDFGDGNSYSATYTPVFHVYNKPGTYSVKLVNTFGTCSETVTKDIVVNPLPNPQGFVADYGGVCGSPVTVKFKDTTAGATAWQWQLDYYYGNTFSTQQNPSYNFLTDGYHTVFLTVTNAYGCSRNTSKTVNIFKPNVSLTSVYSSSPRVNYDCDSLTIKLGVNSNQTIQSYSWNLGNGQTSTEANPQVSYNQQGIYTITLNYVTESGCAGVANYTARVWGKPKADFAYTIPCGNSLNLQFTDRSNFSDYWNWSYGDGWTDYYTSNPIHYYADTGKYMVRFINHIGHCADTVYKEVYANILPSSVSITKALTTCDGTRGEVTFNQYCLRANGGTWDFGDGTTMACDTSVHVVKHTYTSTGTYQVRLTGYYNNCLLSATQTVRILLKQTPLLTASPTQICSNGSINVQLSNLQINPYTGNNQYGQYYIDRFEYDDGTQLTGFTNSYYSWQYTAYTGSLQNNIVGAHQLRAIIRSSNTSCADTSNYVDLLVNGPKTGFTIQNNDQCYKSVFVFTDTSKSQTTTALTRWFWDFGDGTTQTNNSSSQVTHVYQNPNNYTVRITVTDASGCSSSFAKTVYARGAKASFTASGLYVPNVPLNTTINFYNYTYGSSSGTIDYKWIYGDGATSTNYYGVHTYTQAGTYTVYLVATDAATSCADTAKQVITVKDFQTAFAFSSSFIGSNSCPPVLLRINNLSVGYNRLLWDFGDGTSSIQSYPTHTYYKAGVYKIALYTYGYNGLTGTYIDSIEVREPAAQISADILQACTSQSVNLQTNTTNTNNYVWDFGDGIVASGTTALPHSYTAGIYNPKLIAKDKNGCAASTELADKIIIDSLNIAIKGIPSLVCDSALINFTPDVFNYAESKIGTPLSYKWDFGTGNAADTANSKNPSFRYTVPGTYVVKFSVNSQYGCSKQTTANVVVNQKAHGAITAVNEICEDGSVQFTGSANPTGNLQWNWNFANGNTSVQQNPTSQIYTTPGSYSVTMTVNRNGCIDTVTHLLVVNARPVINASPKQYVLCFGDSVQLSSGGGGIYLWSPPSALNNSAIANPMASPATSTKYKVQVTSNKGCVNTDSVSITVAQRIKVQLSADENLCKGSSLQLKASGATSYQWINTTAGLNSTSIPNPIVNVSNTSTYTVVGSDSYNCFKDTASVLVTVRDLPTVNAGPDVSIVGGVPYQLNATVSNDVVSWLWSPGNYLSCTSCASPMATPKMQTTYVVKVSNRWGCLAYDTIVLKLQCAVSNVHIPNAFTPGGNGKNDIFYIKGSGVNVIKHFQIYNRWGQTVFERNNIGIDDRSSGWDGKYKGQYAETGTYVYIAEMECISGEVFTFKGTVTVVK